MLLSIQTISQETTQPSALPSPLLPTHLQQCGDIMLVLRTIQLLHELGSALGGGVNGQAHAYDGTVWKNLTHKKGT